LEVSFEIKHAQTRKLLDRSKFMKASSKVLFTGVLVALPMSICIYLLLILVTETRPPPRDRMRSTAEYFRAVYTEYTTPDVLQVLQNRINFVWNSAPEEQANALVSTPPPVGQRYTLSSQPYAQTLHVGFLRYVLGIRKAMLPGIYINRYDPMNYNRFVVDVPELFKPNTWVEITRTCAPPPQCAYPMCDVYWGIVSPGSGLFLNTGVKPLVANNRFAAYHLVLTKHLGNADSAWEAMATKIDEFRTSRDILDEFRSDWKRIGQRPPLCFRDMGFRKSHMLQRYTLVLLGVLFCVLSLVVLVYLGFAVSEHHGFALLLLGAPYLLWICWFKLGLKGYISASGWYTPEMAKRSMNVDTKQLIKFAAHSDSHHLANGMTMLRIFDQDMLCLAKQQRYSMVMLSSQPNFDCTWLPEFCNLQNFRIREGVCNIQQNFAQGLCSNFQFRTGPVKPDLSPATDCTCCESPNLQCAGCIGHISMDMCAGTYTDVKCLPLLPPASPCHGK
jgi:hypothetical protein